MSLKKVNESCQLIQYELIKDATVFADPSGSITEKDIQIAVKALRRGEKRAKKSK